MKIQPNTNERYPFYGKGLIGKREIGFAELLHCLRNRKNVRTFSLYFYGKERGRYALNVYQGVVSRETCRAL